MYDDRRKYKRIKVSNLARINDARYSVMNISKDGILLSNDHEVWDPGEKIEIQLKVKGKWVDLKAMIMWSMKESVSQAVSMGILITHAPSEYNEFVENLYLEADGR